MSFLQRIFVIASLCVAVLALTAPKWQVLLQDNLPAWAPSFIQSQPRVVIEQGTIIGTVLGGDGLDKPIEAFLGIPYALPPTGDKRFRPAVPLNASSETFFATNFGPR